MNLKERLTRCGVYSAKPLGVLRENVSPHRAGIVVRRQQHRGDAVHYTLVMGDGASWVGEVTLLIVDPKYRKRGIGTALLAKLIEVFKKARIDMLLLNVPVDAVNAKGLYERCGFEVRAYHMRKRL